MVKDNLALCAPLSWRIFSLKKIMLIQFQGIEIKLMNGQPTIAGVLQ